MSMNTFNKILQDVNAQAERKASADRVAKLSVSIHEHLASNHAANISTAEVFEALAVVTASLMGATFSSAVISGEKTIADYDATVEAISELSASKTNKVRYVLTILASTKRL